MVTLSDIESYINGKNINRFKPILSNTTISAKLFKPNLYLYRWDGLADDDILIGYIDENFDVHVKDCTISYNGVIEALGLDPLSPEDEEDDIENVVNALFVNFKIAYATKIDEARMGYDSCTEFIKENKLTNFGCDSDYYDETYD